MKFLIILAMLLSPFHHKHHKPKAKPLYPAVASWFDDSGATASGTHYRYGFASLMFGSQWGKRILFCHGRNCVVGQMEDHGPYVGGRQFDLNPALKNALGCSDICYLGWRAG